jgi:tetratricopeptide (TPR) repeat protein
MKKFLSDVEPEPINFGEPSPEINDLLQQGVVAYRSDRTKADRLFREALARAPDELATYFCLYKIHTYMGSLDFAAEVAIDGMLEAARQAGWPNDPKLWPHKAEAADGPARFALYTLKALSFIELKRGRREEALEHLQTLSKADPSGTVGWMVIQDLAQGVVR